MATAATSTSASHCSRGVATAHTVSTAPSSFGQAVSVPASASAPAKRALRSSLGATLGAIPQDRLLADSAALTQRVTSHPTYQAARAVCLFISMPEGEVQTRGILEHALAAGKTVFVPRILTAAAAAASVAAKASEMPNTSSVTIGAPLPPARMRMLAVSSVSDLASCVANRWGIAEPSLQVTREDGTLVSREEATDCAHLDLVICPGVAFDSSCRRLGHGKGYYDEYLAALRRTRTERAWTRVGTIGIALDEQIIERVPVDERDITLDEILTPTKQFRANDAAAEATVV